MISDQVLVSAGLLTYPGTLLVLVLFRFFNLLSHYGGSGLVLSFHQMAVKTRLPATLPFSRNLHLLLLLLLSSSFSSLPSSSLAADVCASICGFLSPFDQTGPAVHLRLSSLQSPEEVGGSKKNCLAAKCGSGLEIRQESHLLVVQGTTIPSENDKPRQFNLNGFMRTSFVSHLDPIILSLANQSKEQQHYPPAYVST